MLELIQAGSGIDEPELQEYEKEMIRGIGNAVRYDKGQVISGPEIQDSIYLIESGLVGIYRFTGEERRVEGVRGPGYLLSLAEALCGSGTGCYSGAINEVALVSVKREDFRDLLVCDPFFLRKIVGILSCRVHIEKAHLYGIILNKN